MDFESFIKEVSPLTGLQWRHFLKKGIRRKIEKRINEIGINGFKEYFLKIREDLQEKEELSKILKITISRFFRDCAVFDKIKTSLLPQLIKNNKDKINIWSIGCASGEEPYSIALIWKDSIQKNFSDVKCSIIATDIDEDLLLRAREGRYKYSSLKETPSDIVKSYFKKEDSIFVLNESIREMVDFRKHDIIHDKEYGNMDLILCRNLAFTYFLKSTQIEVLRKIEASLRPEGYLVIGKDENIPLTYPELFIPIFREEKIYKKLEKRNY